MKARSLLPFLIALGGLSPIGTPAAGASPAPPVVVASGATTENLSEYSLEATSFTSGRLYVVFLS